MSDDAPARSPATRRVSCAFVQFSEMFCFPAHTVGHLNMCDAMTALGVETTLYMLPPEGVALPSPLDLAWKYGLSAPPRVEWVRPDANKWIARLRVLRECARIGRRVTFTYCTRALPTLGALLGGSTKAVIEIHQPSRFWSRHDRLAFRLARRSRRLRIVCISQQLAGIVAREWGVDESTIIVEHSAHNFPIRDDYATVVGDRGRLCVMYVGSFDSGKGLDTVFEIARLHPEVDVIAVGGEVPLRHLPHNLEVRPRVAHADVPDLLAKADILLMPFNTYAGGGLPSGAAGVAEEFYSPLKMVEYLSAGRVIMASNLPSIAEVLEDGVNSLLVDPDSLASWSAALDRLESDPALRMRLAHGAAQTARRHTTRERARRVLVGIGVLR